MCIGLTVYPNTIVSIESSDGLVRIESVSERIQLVYEMRNRPSTHEFE